MSSREKLAIFGGAKAVSTPLKNRFHFGKEEKEAVDRLFDQCMITGDPIPYNGPEEEAFCKEFVEFMGGGYADGVNSGTNAIFASLHALGLKPFSEVIVGCVTDPGGMMPVVLNNCIPIPADSEPGKYNTGAEQIEARITPQTSAIVVAHIGGEPADIKGIMEVANRHGIPVVEDCAQAHAATVDGKYVGTFGTYGAFSVMHGKHICAGGQGGIVYSKTEDLYWKARRSADRGKPFGIENPCGNVVAAINCNMDDVGAAIGRAQLKKLSSIVEGRRNFLKMLMDRGLGELKAITVPDIPANVKSSIWWVRLGINVKKLTCTRQEYFDALKAEGVMFGDNYRAALPMTFPWFVNRKNCHPWNNPLCQGDPCRDIPCPNVMQSMEDNFNFTIYENWGSDEADMIIEAFRKLDAAYTR